MATCMISRLPIEADDSVYAFLLETAPFFSLPTTPTAQCIPICFAQGSYDGEGGMRSIKNESEITNFLQTFFENNKICQENGSNQDLESLSVRNILHRDAIFRKRSIFDDTSSDSFLSTVFIRADILDPLLPLAPKHPIIHNLEQDVDALIHKAADKRAILLCPEETLEKIKTECFLMESIRELLDRVFFCVIYGNRWDSYLQLLVQSPELFQEQLLFLSTVTNTLDQLYMIWHIPYICTTCNVSSLEEQYMSILRRATLTLSESE